MAGQPRRNAIYATTYETHDSGSNWPAGGPTLCVAFAGADVAAAWSITGSAADHHAELQPDPQRLHRVHDDCRRRVRVPLLLNSGHRQVRKFIGIYFGGSGYTTSAGTFAINWSGPVVTFALAA